LALTCILTIREQNHPVPGTLYLDIRPGVRELRRDHFRISLPMQQFRFIRTLMANAGADVDQWKLFYNIWGEGTNGVVRDEDGGPLNAQQCIHNLALKLRNKLAFMGITVKSVRKGYGYRIMGLEAIENEKMAEVVEAADVQARVGAAVRVAGAH
jgi:DNA-binding response OmpR family regulator